MNKIKFFVVVIFLFLSSCSPNINLDTFSVTFNSLGGTEVQDLDIIEGNKIEEPFITKEGHTLVGWFTANNEKWDFEDFEISSDLILYAIWETNTYTIIFDSNGGSYVENISNKYNYTVNAPDEPYLEGHTFLGWYTDSEFENLYTFERIKENITLYAKWNVNTYTIEFVMLDETIVTTQKFGELIEFPEIPNEFHFEGWYNDSSYSSEAPQYVQESLKVYAKLITKSDNVEFIYNNSNLAANFIYENNGYFIHERNHIYKYDYNFNHLWTKTFQGQSISDIQVIDEIIYVFFGGGSMSSLSIWGEIISFWNFSIPEISNKGSNIKDEKIAIYNPRSDGFDLILYSLDNREILKKETHFFSVGNNIELILFDDAIYLITLNNIYEFNQNLNLVDLVSFENNIWQLDCILLDQSYSVNCNGYLINLEEKEVIDSPIYNLKENYNYFYSNEKYDFYYSFNTYDNYILTYDRSTSAEEYYKLPDDFRNANNYFIYKKPLIDNFGSLLILYLMPDLNNNLGSENKNYLFKIPKHEKSNDIYDLNLFIEDTLIDSIQLNEGDKIPNFKIDTNNFFIIGWFKEIELINQLDYAYMPSQNMNLYAKLLKYDFFNDYSEDVIFDRYYSYKSTIYDSVIDKDNSIIYVGQIFGVNHEKFQLVKFDSTGNLIFKKEIVYLSSYTKVVTDDQGNIYLSGVDRRLYGSYNNTSYRNYPVIIKFDSNGNKVWEFIDTELNEFYNSIEILKDDVIYLGMNNRFRLINKYGEILVDKEISGDSLIFNNKILFVYEGSIREYDIQNDIFISKIDKEIFHSLVNYNCFVIGVNLIFRVAGYAYIFDQEYNLVSMNLYYGPNEKWEKYDEHNYYNYSNGGTTIFNIQSLVFTTNIDVNFSNLMDIKLKDSGFHIVYKFNWSRIYFKYYKFI